MRKSHAHRIEIGDTETSFEIGGTGTDSKPIVHAHDVEPGAERTDKAHEGDELEHDHPTAPIFTGWSDWWGG